MSSRDEDRSALSRIAKEAPRRRYEADLSVKTAKFGWALWHGGTAVAAAAGIATGHTEAGVGSAIAMAGTKALTAGYAAWRSKQKADQATRLRRVGPDDMTVDSYLDQVERDGFNAVAGLSRQEALDFRAGVDQADAEQTLGGVTDTTGWSRAQKDGYRSYGRVLLHQTPAAASAYRAGVVRQLDQRASGATRQRQAGSGGAAGATGAAAESQIARIRGALTALADDAERTTAGLVETNEEIATSAIAVNALLEDAGDRSDRLLAYLEQAMKAVHEAADALTEAAEVSRGFAEAL